MQLVTSNIKRIGNEAAIGAAISTASLLIFTVLFIAVTAILVTRHRAKMRSVLHHSAVATQDRNATHNSQDIGDVNDEDLALNTAYASAESILNQTPAVQLQANAAYIPTGEIQLEANASYTLNKSTTHGRRLEPETKNVPMTTNIAYISSAQHMRAQPSSIPTPRDTLVDTPMTVYESPTQHIPNATYVPRQDISVEENPAYAVTHDSSITVETNVAYTSSLNI